MKNILAVLFVLATQASCAAFYSLDHPPSFGAVSPLLKESVN